MMNKRFCTTADRENRSSLLFTLKDQNDDQISGPYVEKLLNRPNDWLEGSHGKKICGTIPGNVVKRVEYR